MDRVTRTSKKNTFEQGSYIFLQLHTHAIVEFSKSCEGHYVLVQVTTIVVVAFKV